MDQRYELLFMATTFKERKGVVRDNPKIKILECEKCGLVQLDETSHIVEGFYEESHAWPISKRNK